MTKEDIIRMAREVGLPHWYQTGEVVNIELLERFAQLVDAKATAAAIASEREACAVIAEELFCGCGRGNCPKEDTRAQEIAYAIRARGQQ